MKAVILAAGRGRRMGELTAHAPKPLVIVAGKTFLDHIFDSLPAVVTEVIVIVGYRGGMIQKYLGERYKGRAVSYVTQTVFDGQAKAFLLARPLLEPSGERFFIINGDEIPSLKEMKDCLTHPYSVLCHPLTRSIPTAVVRLNKAGRILSISERRFGFKPPRISDGGVLLVDRNIFRYKPRKHAKTGEYYLTSMLAPFLKDFPVYAVMGAPDLYFVDSRDIDRFNADRKRARG